jgi:hypothetical protein
MNRDLVASYQTYHALKLALTQAQVDWLSSVPAPKDEPDGLARLRLKTEGQKTRLLAELDRTVTVLRSGAGRHARMSRIIESWPAPLRALFRSRHVALFDSDRDFPELYEGLFLGHPFNPPAEAARRPSAPSRREAAVHARTLAIPATPLRLLFVINQNYKITGVIGGVVVGRLIGFTDRSLWLDITRTAHLPDVRSAAPFKEIDFTEIAKISSPAGVSVEVGDSSFERRKEVDLHPAYVPACTSDLLAKGPLTL